MDRQFGVSLVFFIVQQVIGQSETGNRWAASSGPVFLDSDSRDVMIKWRSNATHFELETIAKTTGWIAVEMRGSAGNTALRSDVVVMGVDDADSTPYVQDGWIKSIARASNDTDVQTTDVSAKILIDSRQHWVSVSGSQNSTHTIVRTTRALVTCDNADLSFTGDPIRLSYVTGSPDLSAQASTMQVIFSEKKTKIYPLLPSSAVMKTRLNRDSSIGYLDLKADEVVVPAGKITSHCVLIKLPELPVKYHVVAVREGPSPTLDNGVVDGFLLQTLPAVTPGNEDMVLGATASICSTFVDDAFPSKDFDCSDGSDPLYLYLVSNCTRMLAATGRKSEVTAYPAEAGYPLSSAVARRYIFLKQDYNNSVGKSRTDSSGISLALTPNLRSHDSAMLAIGYDQDAPGGIGLVVPAETDSFLVDVLCSSSCTELFTSEITISNVLFISGAKSRTMKLRHIRKGKEFTPVASDPFYNSSVQTNQAVLPPRTVLPGDALILECGYSSGKIDDVTSDGKKLYGDTCLAYVTFYVPSGPASSSPGPVKCGSSGEVQNKYRWVPADTRDSTQFYTHGSVITSCVVDDQQEPVYAKATLPDHLSFQPQKNPQCNTSDFGVAGDSQVADLRIARLQNSTWNANIETGDFHDAPVASEGPTSLAPELTSNNAENLKVPDTPVVLDRGSLPNPDIELMASTLPPLLFSNSAALNHSSIVALLQDMQQRWQSLMELIVTLLNSTEPVLLESS